MPVVTQVPIPAVTVAMPQIPAAQIVIPRVPVTPNAIALPVITPLGATKQPIPLGLVAQAPVVIPQIQARAPAIIPAAVPLPIVQPPAVPTVGQPFLTLNVQPRVPAFPVPNMIPIPTPVTMRPVRRELELRPWQVDWAHRAHNILLANHGYIDTSRMRSGKTYVTLWLAKQFGFRLFIVCPATIIDVWRRTAAEYGVEVVDIVSYQSLRSQKNRQPKHGYLDRHDNITEGGIHQVNFTPTRGYLNLVEQGVMVVCDEIQNIKNNSAQYKACNALIRPIISAGGRSRFGLLSGTPFDKEEHAVNLLKLIGYIRAHRLYNYIRETRELVLEGMQELIDACRFINREETERVLAEIPQVKGKMNHLCYTLYTRVVKANLSGAMTAPTDITGRFDVGNGFYNMTEDRAEQLRAAIDELAQAVRYNERTGAVTMNADNIGRVTSALVHIENAKAYDWARVGTGLLMADPRLKLVISVNYTSTIDEIKNLMLFFNPLVLNGKIVPRKRSEIVRQFNEDPARRVIIMNTAVGGVGISLYRANVDEPRYTLMSPSYKLLEVTQAAARTYGPGMQADATVRMFYGNGTGNLETGILTALARKSEILKGTLEDNIRDTLVLPGDYPAFNEAAA